MAANSSFEIEIEELKAVLDDLKSRFDYIQSSNQHISQSNSSLTEIIASFDHFKNEINQFTQVLAEKYNTKPPTKEQSSNSQNEIISIFTNSRDTLSQISQQRIKDIFTIRQLRIIRPIFQNVVDMTKYFFSFRKVPIPQLSSKTLRMLTEPLDPMRFTQLFNFPEDFSTRSAFDQTCAFQAFDVRLDNIFDAFTSQIAYYTAKCDDTKTMLLFPQQKTMVTYPKFNALVSLHKKLMSQFGETNVSCTASAAKISNILVQIKNRLNSTSQFFTKSVNEMRDDTAKAKAKYVSTCLLLSKYRAIDQISVNPDLLSIFEHKDNMARYSDTENKFVISIIDYEKLKKFLESLTNFKQETEQKNQDFKKLLKYLETEPNKPEKDENTHLKAQLRAAGAVLEEQIKDGFAAYAFCFKVASDMTISAEEYVTAAKTVGQAYDNVNYLIQTVSSNPSNAWVKSVQNRMKDLVASKKEEVEKCQKEAHQLQEENIETKRIIEEMKTAKPSKTCTDCLCDPQFCVVSCGHTFCAQCIEKAKQDHKCPICGKEFGESDIVKIVW